MDTYRVWPCSLHVGVTALLAGRIIKKVIEKQIGHALPWRRKRHISIIVQSAV